MAVINYMTGQSEQDPLECLRELAGLLNGDLLYWLEPLVEDPGEKAWQTGPMKCLTRSLPEHVNIYEGRAFGEKGGAHVLKNGAGCRWILFSEKEIPSKNGKEVFSQEVEKNEYEIYLRTASEMARFGFKPKEWGDKKARIIEYREFTRFFAWRIHPDLITEEKNNHG